MDQSRTFSRLSKDSELQDFYLGCLAQFDFKYDRLIRYGSGTINHWRIQKQGTLPSLPLCGFYTISFMNMAEHYHLRLCDLDSCFQWRTTAMHTTEVLVKNPIRRTVENKYIGLFRDHVPMFFYFFFSRWIS